MGRRHLRCAIAALALAVVTVIVFAGWLQPSLALPLLLGGRFCG